MNLPPMTEAQQKELAELHMKNESLQRQLYAVQQQVALADKEKRRAILTKKELRDAPNETRCFKAVGRMFVLTPNGELMKQLTRTVDSSDSQMAKAAEKKIYLESCLKDSQRNMQEMLKSLMSK
eukprot:Rmarinus@m.19516